MPIQDDYEFLTESEYQQLKAILLEISTLCFNLKVKKQEMTKNYSHRYHSVFNSSTLIGRKKFCYWVGEEKNSE